jgi:hypothetical protein
MIQTALDKAQTLHLTSEPYTPNPKFQTTNPKPQTQTARVTRRHVRHTHSVERLVGIYAQRAPKNGEGLWSKLLYAPCLKSGRRPPRKLLVRVDGCMVMRLRQLPRAT